MSRTAPVNVVKGQRLRWGSERRGRLQSVQAETGPYLAFGTLNCGWWLLAKLSAHQPGKHTHWSNCPYLPEESLSDNLSRYWSRVCISLLSHVLTLWIAIRLLPLFAHRPINTKVHNCMHTHTHTHTNASIWAALCVSICAYKNIVQACTVHMTGCNLAVYCQTQSESISSHHNRLFVSHHKQTTRSPHIVVIDTDRLLSLHYAPLFHLLPHPLCPLPLSLSLSLSASHLISFLALLKPL